MAMDSGDSRIGMLGNVAGRIVTVAVSFGFVFWLVDAGFWLKFLLATVMANGASAATANAIERMRVRELLAQYRTMFDIADAQLVKVSADVDRFNERESDWDQIDDLKRRVEELEDLTDRLLRRSAV
jgi:siroheme synthase (precorrin-2 oxidase/ferrochelatase)